MVYAKNQIICSDHLIDDKMQHKTNKQKPQTSKSTKKKKKKEVSSSWHMLFKNDKLFKLFELNTKLSGKLPISIKMLD